MSNKVPQIRFNGYSDDWEERKLGQLFNQEVQYIDPKAENVPLWSLTVADGLVEKTDRYNREFLVKKNDKFKLVKDNWFTYNPMNMTLGALDVNELGQDIAVSGYYVTMSLDNQFNRTFLKTWMKSDKAIGLFKLYATGSLIEKQRVQFGTLSEIPSKFPEYEEQTQIGQFFDSLDNLIAANQRKLDLLKEQKKGYLQKMFPKNGEKVPELRFAGFADDWEERKLSDLFIKGGSGGTPKSTNKAFYDGDIPFLGISDITKSNGFINSTEKHISSDGLNSSAAWIVSKGAISLAMYASVGKLAILNIDAATSQAFYNMIFDDYDLRDIVYQRLNKANELSEWNKLISTGTQSNLNADKVKNFQMYLPKNHDETKLISTFFKQIDNTIALHQRKLDLLKEQKKGLLQKMFV